MTERENNFGLLHLLGAALVMYGHQWALLGASAPVILGNSVSSLGVKIIFVISGYLMTQSFLRSERLLPFLKRRLIRIYPALLCCLVLSVLLLYPISGQPLGLYLRQAARYLLYNLIFRVQYTLPGVFESNPYPNAINGSLWTMPVEVGLYLLLGLGLWALGRLPSVRGKELRTPVWALLVVSSVALILSWSLRQRYPASIAGDAEWRAALDLMPYFLCGSLCRLADLRRYLHPQLAALLLFCACCVSWRGEELLCVLVLPYAVLSFALCEKPRFSHVTGKLNLAYSFYLYAFPVQQAVIWLFWVRLGFHASPNVFFLMSLPFVLLLSLLSAKLVETPTERFLKKLLRA